MARFRVKAPDGRTVTLEGDAPPTDTELDEIFASLPATAEPAAPSPDGRDLEGVVSNPPGGGYSTEPFVGPRPGPEDVGHEGPYRTMAEMPKGMLKSLSRNLLGAAKLNPVSMALRATGGPDPTGDMLEQGREGLRPSSLGEEKAADLESFLEFFASGPGPILKAGKAGPGVLAFLRRAAVPALAVTKGAVESGIVGSAQAGELNPEAATGGAIGGGIGYGLNKAATRLLSRWLSKSPEQLARAVHPSAGFHGDKTISAAAEILDEGVVASGWLPDIDRIAQRSAERTSRLATKWEAYRAATDAAPIIPRDLAELLRAEARKQVRPTPGGVPNVIDQPKYSQLMSMADELMEAEGKPAPTKALFYPPRPAKPAPKAPPPEVPLGDMEDKLQAWQKRPYERTDPTRDPAKKGVDLLREALNAEPGGRRAVMDPLSRSIEFSSAAEKAAEAARLSTGSHAGQQFTVRALLGPATAAVMAGSGTLAGGGSVGTASVNAAATALAYKLVQTLNSPGYQAMSAQQKYNLAKTLLGNTDLSAALIGLWGERGSQEHVNETGPEADGTTQEAMKYVLQKLHLKVPEAPR